MLIRSGKRNNAATNNVGLFFTTQRLSNTASLVIRYFCSTLPIGSYAVNDFVACYAIAQIFSKASYSLYHQSDEKWHKENKNMSWL